MRQVNRCVFAMLMLFSWSLAFSETCYRYRPSYTTNKDAIEKTVKLFTQFSDANTALSGKYHKSNVMYIEYEIIFSEQDGERLFIALRDLMENRDGTDISRLSVAFDNTLLIMRVCKLRTMEVDKPEFATMVADYNQIYMICDLGALHSCLLACAPEEPDIIVDPLPIEEEEQWIPRDGYRFVEIKKGYSEKIPYYIQTAYIDTTKFDNVADGSFSIWGDTDKDIVRVATNMENLHSWSLAVPTYKTTETMSDIGYRQYAFQQSADSVMISANSIEEKPTLKLRGEPVASTLIYVTGYPSESKIYLYDAKQDPEAVAIKPGWVMWSGAVGLTLLLMLL